MHITVVTAFLFMTSVLFAQEFDIEQLNSLPAKPKALILSQIEALTDESRYVSTAPMTTLELQTFGKKTSIIKIEAPLEKVWDAYTQITPEKVWTGPIVNFVFAYSKREKKYFYPGDNMPFFEPGLVVQNYLNIAGKILQVAVMVTRVDEQEKLIEIAYTEGNASRGTQILRFVADGQNTKIVHRSIYKSGSKVRDRLIYPIFHKITTGEHHKKMRKIILE